MQCSSDVQMTCQPSFQQNQTTFQEPSAKSGISLRDILRNPNSLSYFMEFMDRRNRSLPVQFWLTVESFKNPLESVDSDTSGEEEEIIQDPSTFITVKEDISMINNLYFSDGRNHGALATISKKYIETIQEFVQDSDPSVAAQRRVRRCVLLAQIQVERDMEHDFDDFERSELWFRAIGDAAFVGDRTHTDPFAKERDSPSDLQETSPSSAGHSKRPRSPLNPLKQPRSDAPRMIGMQRTASSNSNHSVQSKGSNYTPSNIEVLMSPAPDTSFEPSRAPLFDDPEDELQRAEEKRMEAIHAALTDIMASEQEPSDGPSVYESKSGPLFNSVRVSERPKRPAMFEEGPPDDIDAEDAEQEGSLGPSSYQLAAPGDLQLSYEISRLGENITNLEAQDAILDTFIKKAELTGDTQELKFLTKSKSSMTRELRQLQFQKQQYEQQEVANRLISDRTKVLILNSTVAEEEGKSVVRYLVEVQQLAADGSFASGWVVARRYNEFHNMHNKLKERYVLVRNLDFPGKRLVATLSGSFLDTRRVALEKYLQVS